MAKIVTDNSHYINIANKIREKTGTSFTYKPEEMPNGIEQVYAAGYINGGAGSGGGESDAPVIRKQASGNPVALTDVSENKHNISIQLISSTIKDFSHLQIKVTGKNLVDTHTALIGKAISGAGVNSVIFASNNSAKIIIPYIRVIPGMTYSFSLDNSDYWLDRICQMNDDNVCTENHSWYTNTAYNYSSATISTHSNTTWLAIGLAKTTGDKIATQEDLEQINLQFERRSEPSSFEPYWEELYTANAIGYIADVPSQGPSMNIEVATKPVVNTTGAIGVTHQPVILQVFYNQSYGVNIERQLFWDSFQQKGARDNYSNACQYYTDDMFHPQHNIVPTNFNYAMAYTKIGDLKGILQSSGIQLDTSKATGVSEAFRGGTFTHIPTIDLTSVATSATSVFYYCTHLHTIDKLIVSDKITNYTSMFGYCSKLVNLEIEGIIAAKGFSTQHSKKLSKQSIISIISHLSQTVSGLTVTFSTDAIKTAFETDDPATCEEWNGLLEEYASNWTVTLA